MINRRTALRQLGLGLAALTGGSQLRGQSALPERDPELSLINLAGNENPFGPSVRVVTQLGRQLTNSCRYPFREERILREDLAAQEGVGVEQVVLGNGCDEILSLIASGLLRKNDKVVATRPTYLQLMDYAERVGAVIEWVDHDTGTMCHDLAAMEAAVDSTTALVYVCNPDTPSGTRLDPGQLEAFCRRVCQRCPVVVDEVYLDLLDTFAQESMVHLVRDGYPIIITRSFSKLHALAGHRVGHAVGPVDLIERLGQRKMSGLNYLGVVAARTSVTDHGFHRISRQKIAEGRERLYALLRELQLPYIESCGNFVFHYTGIPNADYQALMRERGILVGRSFPPYTDWNRLSIGTESEMRSFTAAFTGILSARR
jgi:histidinol-phosphate aminotransferase